MEDNVIWSPSIFTLMIRFLVHKCWLGLTNNKNLQILDDWKSNGAFKVGYKFHIQQDSFQPCLMEGLSVEMFSGILWASNRKALRGSC